jgi:hypothetical protein
MASDGTSGKIPVASPVQGSQAAKPINFQSGNGKSLPPSGKTATAPRVAAAEPAASAASASTKAAVQQSTDPRVLVDQLNKYLNDSGRPDQFRVAPNSGGKLIQQVNPANGAVIGEFSASEFPALARSIGASGLLVDSIV